MRMPMDDDNGVAEFESILKPIDVSRCAAPALSKGMPKRSEINALPFVSEDIPVSVSTGCSVLARIGRRNALESGAASSQWKGTLSFVSA